MGTDYPHRVRYTRSTRIPFRHGLAQSPATRKATPCPPLSCLADGLGALANEGRLRRLLSTTPNKDHRGHGVTSYCGRETAKTAGERDEVRNIEPGMFRFKSGRTRTISRCLGVAGSGALSVLSSAVVRPARFYLGTATAVLTSVETAEPTPTSN